MRSRASSSGHRILRCVADGGSGFCLAVLPPLRRRSHHELYVPALICHLGDYDPSGVNAGEKIEETLRELAPDAEIEFERLGVTPNQIELWNLPERPTKQSSHNRGWEGGSVELDAIPPETLRAIVRVAIEEFLPREQFEILQEGRNRSGLRCGNGPARSSDHGRSHLTQTGPAIDRGDCRAKLGRVTMNAALRYVSGKEITSARCACPQQWQA